MSFYGEIIYGYHPAEQRIIGCELEDEFLFEVSIALKELSQRYAVRKILIREDEKVIALFSSKKDQVLLAFMRWLDTRRFSKKAPELIQEFKKRNIQFETSRDGIRFKSKKEARRGVRLARRIGLSHVLGATN